VTPYLEKFFSPMIEKTIILAKGEKVFDILKLKRKKRDL
jgi:hypothetical protein